MKNYYKILGVKKDASEEEIREHWVEWMRKLHPDQRIEGKAEDERIKEINEAYQVLKHSSTRVEYDLKRAYDRGKRNSYLRGLSIPIAIFVVFVIIGTIYLSKSQVTLQANLLTRDRVNQIDEMNQTNQIDQKNNPNGLSGSADQRIDVTTQKPNDPIDPKMERRNDSSSRRRIHASTPPRFDASTDPRVDSSTPPRIDAKDAMTQRLDGQSTYDLINASTHQPTPTLTHPPTVESTHEPVSASSYQRLDASSHSRILASTPLIATEEEVRRFFFNYTERYTQKDLDSFISLFSSRVIQNRQDGLEGIRKIYGNFLKQSQEIKYDIDHIKIEIYQNGVEVKARYELVQMMKKSGDKRIWRGGIRWSLIKEDGALKIHSIDYQHQKSP